MDEKPKKRHWFQLRLITCIGMMLTAATLIGVNVVWVSPRTTEETKYTVVYRGWPYYWDAQVEAGESLENSIRKSKDRIVALRNQVETDVGKTDVEYNNILKAGGYSVEELKHILLENEQRFDLIIFNFNKRLGAERERLRFYESVGNSIGKGYLHLNMNVAVAIAVLVIFTFACESLLRRHARKRPEKEPAQWR